jgi:hypothetical protein
MSGTRNRPILVTGTQRSGSTWVGQMIASHPRVVYIWEPFNKKVPNSPIKYWYHHVTPHEQERFRAYLQPHLTFRYPWWAAIKDRPHPRRVVGTALRTAQCCYRRMIGCRPLMKDPSALFAAEWLAQNYDMDMVVLIRHPAAFASSMKRLNWPFWFGELWPQQELMRDYLEPFRDEVRRAAEKPPDLIDQAILIWRIIHHVILRFQRAHPDWIFLRHEDLSRQPVEEFAKLFARLGLDMLPRVRRTIEAHTAEDNPKEAAEKIAHQLKRDSKGNIWNWRSRLLPEEIARVRQGTQDIARHFYTEADWGDGRETVRRSA